MLASIAMVGAPSTLTNRPPTRGPQGCNTTPAKRTPPLGPTQSDRRDATRPFGGRHRVAHSVPNASSLRSIKPSWLLATTW
jgi:hypothetical protein